VEITYAESKKTGMAINQRSATAQEFLNDQLSNIIYNKSDIHKPNIVHKEQTDIYEYVIITTDNFEGEFQPLAEWKTQKGVSATIISTSYIYDNYDGIDNAEKVRNFIKDYYQNHGTLWVLLGGDTSFVPYREAFAFDCEYSSYSDNFLPCDLYFSDLDGTWNDNGNDIWGELEDNVDMYPDVFVGRASIENSAEATAFVDKILTYEKNPPVGYQTDMLFLAQVLWDDPYTDSGVSKNYIDDAYVPDRFDPITKLYESLGNNTYDNVIANLNAGTHIVNHCGRALYGSMSLGSGHLYNSDMDNLINAPAFSIWYTIGCWPAAFDYNCIAEHWINNPNGGGVAFIGNSRYGWGSPGNPLYGYSDTFDQEFYKQLFQEEIYNIGSTLAMAKSVYVPYSRNENVFRWCEYEINLLGEPEMYVWTDVPETLHVTCPDSVTIGTCDVQVSVRNGTQPLRNALVCIMQSDEVYQAAYTDLQGMVQFQVSTGNVTDDILLTVTAQNFLPYQNTIKVIADQPYVMIDSYAANNSVHGYVIPGTSVTVDAGFHNFGQMPAQDVEIILTADSDLITLLDSTHFIPYLDPKTGIFEENVFAFELSQSTENGEVIPIHYSITDNADGFWEGTISITGAIPEFEYIYHQILDSTNGNGNGIPEPGEEVEIKLIVKNSGLQKSNTTQLDVNSDSPYVEIPYCIWQVGDIPSQHCTDVTITLSIKSSCIPPEFADLELIFSDSLGFTSVDTCLLTIGETGFFDDMESGSDKWTHWGTNDLWHLTDRKSVSEEHSWYCGIEDSTYYPDEVEEILESISFAIGVDPTLTFWSWYEFTNYGVDGFYVEVHNGTEWLTLDFIGSGGALPVLTTKNAWLEYEYDLSFIPSGTEIQLRFRFVSDDEDVAEGVYIDDVQVFTDNSPVHGEFVANSFYGQEPFTVQFIDRSYAETGPIVTWNWDFGDGSYSDQINPEHIYDEDGLKTVTLLVTDQFGIASTIQKADYIHVLPDTTKTVYVNLDGTGDFITIAEALNVLNAGDSVMIADGVYEGSMNTNLVIPNDNITILSENGFESCIIDGSALSPAIMCGFKDGVTIEGITFSSCYHSGYGGAISTNGSATFLNCYFDECSSDYDGGAIWAVGGTSIRIEDCIFENCDADEGGAAYIELVEQVQIENSDFYSCQSNEFSGGAVFLNVINTVDIKNCIFDDCSVFTVGEGAGLYAADIFSLQVKYSHFNGCHAANSGGGMYTDGCQDVFVDSCFFMYNTSVSGGACKMDDSYVDMTHCEIGFNEATVGSGFYIGSGSLVMIDNSLFYENSSMGTTSKGGALYVNDGVAAIINSTIVDNIVSTQGGGISHLGTNQMSIYNTILWNNQPADIWAVDSTKINIAFSDVTLPWSGQGNISADPVFVDVSTQNYHLDEFSPCIDIGRNNYVMVDTDIDAHIRIWDGSGIGEAIVDMGCYEYGAPLYDIDEEIPEQNEVSLLKNFPNPFNAVTAISFYMPHTQKATIEIYNIKGQKVRILIQDNIETGYHKISWDGTDQHERRIANGVYFYVLKAGNKQTIKKLLLMR
ncbi:MAG TPA: T9SS type A sorting domain-containing protein, partial [Candidatus Cloacimonetes bacterium]|nr:T9SS type A sorting domain-containing protein [Candidatus Cloacimonadota bacterium]